MSNDNAGPPSVSVVIPAYNAAACIERAVRSVCDQTLNDLEILIVDDVSTDDTVAVVRALAATDPRIRLLRAERNGGPSAARNLGFAAARGTWISILDADDAFMPERLATLVARAEAQKLDVIADNIDLYDYHAEATVSQVMSRLKTFKGDYFALSLEEFLRHDFVNNGFQFGLMKPVYSAAFLRAHDLTYPTAYRHGEDSYLYSAMLACGAKVEVSKAAYYLYTPTFGPVSRKYSEFSQTKTDYINKARSCDDFLAVYGDRISPRARSLVVRRRAKMLAFHEHQITLESRRTLGLFGTLKRVMTHPASMPFLAVMVIHKLRATLALRSRDMAGS